MPISCREVLDSQFRPSKFPKAFTYALIYVTSTLTLPNAIFTFLAFPEEASKYGELALPEVATRLPPAVCSWLVACLSVTNSDMPLTSPGPTAAET